MRVSKFFSLLIPNPKCLHLLQCFLSILLLVISHLAIGQVKFEKESRIKERFVPTSAVEFVKSAGFIKKVKWYKEQGIDRVSFEAKAKYKGSKYSIEFDSSGKLEDIEVDIKWKKVPQELSSKIEEYWSQNHQKTKVCKTQMQYTGEETELRKAISNLPFNATRKYEIVVKVKTDNQHLKMEYLFSDKGIMEKKSKIISKNTDNLEY